MSTNIIFKCRIYIYIKYVYEDGINNFKCPGTKIFHKTTVTFYTPRRLKILYFY